MKSTSSNLNSSPICQECTVTQTLHQDYQSNLKKKQNNNNSRFVTRMLTITGGVDRASTTETVDCSSIPTRVKTRL